jgi:hypothetical protein
MTKCSKVRAKRSRKSKRVRRTRRESKTDETDQKSVKCRKRGKRTRREDTICKIVSQCSMRYELLATTLTLVTCISLIIWLFVSGPFYFVLVLLLLTAVTRESRDKHNGRVKNIHARSKELMFHMRRSYSETIENLERQVGERESTIRHLRQLLLLQHKKASCIGQS